MQTVTDRPHDGPTEAARHGRAEPHEVIRPHDGVCPADATFTTGVVLTLDR